MIWPFRLASVQINMCSHWGGCTVYYTNGFQTEKNIHTICVTRIMYYVAQIETSQAYLILVILVWNSYNIQLINCQSDDFLK